MTRTHEPKPFSGTPRLAAKRPQSSTSLEFPRTYATKAIKGRSNKAGSVAAHWIQILVITFIFLSQFGIRLLTINSRYLIEPAVILFYVVAAANKSARRALYSVFGNTRFRIAVIACVGLFLIGVVNFEDIIGPYADLRACLALLLCYFLISTRTPNENSKRHALIHLAFATIIFDLISSRIFVDPNSDKNQFNIVACVALLYLAARERKSLVFTVAAALGAYEAIISFYRTYWVVIGISCLLFGTALVIDLIRSGRLRSAAALGAGLCLPLAVLVQSGAVTNYLYSSESRFIQSVGKTTETLNALSGDSSLKKGDDIRLGYYQFILEKPQSILLPRGLGYRDTQGNLDEFFDRFGDGVGGTQDSGIFYMAFHLGLPLTLLVLKVLWTQFRARLRLTPFIDKFYVCSGLAILAIYMSTSGDQFVMVERGVWFGIFLGILRNRDLIPSTT